MNCYRAAIIGLTEIAAGPGVPAPDPVLGWRMPQNHAAAYALAPRVDVVAVCDIAPARLDQFQQTWGSVWPHARSYTDYRAMLAQERLDLLSICTPDHLHADMVVAACEAGVKGILCEKPIATTLADADRMIDAVERHGVYMSVDHTRRWHPEYHEARQMVRQGKIGRLTRIVATMNGERAMLFRNGTHALDLTVFFAESEPAWVIGVLDEAFADYGPRYAGDGGHNPRTDPGALALIGFQNGVRAVYQGSQDTVAYAAVELVGTTGRVHLGLLDNQVRVALRGPDGPYDLVYRDAPRSHPTRAGLLGVVEEMVDLVERGGQTVSPPRQARATLAILLGILQSAAQGGARVDLPLQDA